MIQIFGILASWTVTLGSGKDDYQLQKGIKMLCRELSSFNRNGFVILRCLGSFFDTLIVNFGSIRVLDDFGLDRIWTCETEFEQFFDVSCHEFCTGFIFFA